MIHFSVVGDGAVRAQLRRIGAGMAAAAAPATEAAGDIVEEAARQLAAVLTGEMRDSIRSETALSGPTSASVDVLTDNDHAVFNEFGTMYMAAQPFMRPAMDENEASAVAAIASVLRAGMGVAA